MPKKTITITIDADGAVTVEAHGYNGHGCTEATKAVEEALGVVSNRTKKAEFYSAATTQRQTQTT